MTPGEVLLWLGLASGVAGLALPRLAPWPARVHAASVLAALALLVVAFLAADLSYLYVWAHTSPDYPWWYQLAGTWGGEEGTLLVWNGGVAAALLVLLRPAATDLRRRASVALLAFSTALTLVSVAVRALTATPADLLSAAPTGRGLADVLLTPLMVIHPPVQFVGYALVAVPGAYAAAHLWGGGEPRAWTRAAYPWARLAWLFATVGLGLGSLWAYYVLSFGGYWAWDPVETSNLLPWLALTAFVHAAKHHEKFGDLALSSQALALAGPLLAVFATFATRSGLWASVHAFTDPTDRFEPDAPARLLAILDVHPPTRAVLALLAALALVAGALLARHHAKGAYLRVHVVLALALAGAFAADPRAAWGYAFQAASLVGVPLGLALLGGWLLGAPLLLAFLDHEGARGRGWLDPRRVMAVAVALFAVALAVTFVLNLQVVDRPDRARFDVRAPFVVLPLVSVLTVMMGLPPLGKRGAATLAAGGAATGLLLWALADEHRLVALSLPFLVAALVAVLLRLARVQGGRSWSGGAMLAAGLALVVLASNPPTHVGGAAVPAGAWVAAAGLALGAGLLVAGVARVRGRLDAPRLRETGIAVIHLAVVLGLLGYAASTYSQERETFTALPLGTEVEVGDHRLALLPAATATGQDGALDAVRIPVGLARDGGDAGRASLDFSWRGPPASHYAPRLEVRRGLAEDVYLAPLAFQLADGTWVGGGSAGARVPAGEVVAVTFTASVLPLVGLVWAGLWMGVVGMLLVLASVALERRRVRQP